ncbi:MAG TPA: BTAD domain-containing putative transcriptional regulator [Paucimonas sp.]|nr:BTAD domain-containing putative transcriptional regulator [Paucimonas sp.]
MRQSDLPAKYAKLSPPRVHDALPRPRLYARIDALRAQHAVVWLASPPGAGKTTLAASYLRVSAPSHFTWFQIDKDDSDPAKFFFFLAEAVRDSGPPLPWLAPELINDVPRFARLFFRQFYARLPEDAMIVFDNLQDFDWERWGELMEIAFGEAPRGVTILALSRDLPPARLARIELSGQLASLGWNDLRLDADEARALAQLNETGDPNRLAWLERIDGWAAGIIMLREYLNKHQEEPGLPLPQEREALFRYFAGEILERMPKSWQHLLLLLSYLPGVSAKDAAQVTGDSSASRILSHLFHNRWFVERRGTETLTYHFHALFREFLQYEAAQRLDPEEKARLLERIAAILEERGQFDEAARLYHDAGAYHSLRQLLLRCAGGMLAAGRGQAWREWLHWLPPGLVDDEPWLWYWEGASLNHVDAPLGREILNRAERAFAARGDTRAQLLAVTAIIDSYLYEWADFHALQGLIDVMTDALGRLDMTSIEPDADLKIHSRLTLALFFTDPTSPLLERALQRSLSALHIVSDQAERLSAGAFLLYYMNASDANAARRLFLSLNSLADAPAISPLHRIWWYRPAVSRLQLDGDFEGACHLLTNAKRLARDFGLTHLEFHLHFKSGLNHLSNGDVAATADVLDAMRSSILPTHKLDLVYLKILEACYLAQSGEAQAALRAGEDAMRIGSEAAFPPTMQCQLSVILACCSAQSGDTDAAQRWCAKALEHAYGRDEEFSLDVLHFITAYTSHRNGEEDKTMNALRGLLQNLRERPPSLSIVFGCFPQLAGTVLALALKEKLETDLVRGLILRHRLVSPDRHHPDWPWPTAIRSFGKMELSLNGEPVSASGKAQQRPLALLKALLVAGDAGKPQQSLATQLWPDADDAKAALNVTVHRLRKWLACDDAIVVANGKVRLSDSKVWTDVAAFSYLCDLADALPADAPATQLRRLATDILNLYQGPFCDGDEDSWLLPARDRWRQRFDAVIVKLGQRLEALADWAAAQQLYLRALEAEPLMETFYQGLMRCAHAQHDPSAAFSAYRRCRETLATVLGIPPSAATEKLAVQLGLK